MALTQLRFSSAGPSFRDVACPRRRTGHSVHRCPISAAAYGNGSLPYTTAGTQAGDSDRVTDYLKSPFDVAAFGPRLAVGALLSAQEVAQSMQSDIERATSLLQGPQPPSEKQQIFAQALESRIATCLQRGASVEAELLTVVTGLLPADIQQQLPAGVKDILLRGTSNKRVPPTPPTFEEVESVPIMTVAKNQTAAEMVDLRGAVTSLKGALADLGANADPAQVGVLKLNVTDARSGLSRRLQQLSPAALSVSDAPIAAATEEARSLLREAEMLPL